MKKFLFILVFIIPIFSLANDFVIDERKSDIYFANSVLTTEQQAQRNLKNIIMKNILQEQYNGDFAKMEQELNFDVSYNQTHGYSGDIYDTFMMLSSEEDGWDVLNTIMSFIFEEGLSKGINKAAKKVNLPKHQQDLLDRILDSIDLKNLADFFQEVRDIDLSKQIAQYQNSIRHGHGVIVIAHGKGDIFTAKAYEEMLKPDSLNGVEYRDNNWLKDYFQWISIGSPSRDRISSQPHVGFDNDPFAAIGVLSTINNPNRYQFKNGVGEVVDDTDINFHNFKYYLGMPVHIKDGYKDSDVSTNSAKVIIMELIKNAINKHKANQSQWAVDKEYDEGTQDYRISVKHLYNDKFLNNIMKDVKVFPFNGSKKLYPLPSPTEDGEVYVKASIGGEKILDNWDGQEDNQFYKLEGTDPVEYIERIKCDYIHDAHNGGDYDIDACIRIANEQYGKTFECKNLQNINITLAHPDDDNISTCDYYPIKIQSDTNLGIFELKKNSFGYWYSYKNEETTVYKTNNTELKTHIQYKVLKDKNGWGGWASHIIQEVSDGTTNIEGEYNEEWHYSYTYIQKQYEEGTLYDSLIKSQEITTFNYIDGTTYVEDKTTDIDSFGKVTILTKSKSDNSESYNYEYNQQFYNYKAHREYWVITKELLKSTELKYDLYSIYEIQDDTDEYGYKYSILVEDLYKDAHKDDFGNDTYYHCTYRPTRQCKVLK